MNEAREGRPRVSSCRRRSTPDGRRHPTVPIPSHCSRSRTRAREPDLVPVRHGRMLVSPFTFYRGAAKIMAADLKDTPTAGLNVQLCGDAHLSNFGAFASPERTLLFDLNDFDETLPGPFEYDVKRMAASFMIAARNNSFTRSDARAATCASVAAYRTQMAEFAEMRTLDIWYARLAEQELMSGIKDAARAMEQRGQQEGRQDRGEDRRETGAKGAHPRQRAGAVEAGRARRWPLPDRQPATGRDPATRPGAAHRSFRRRVGTRDPRPVPRLPQDVAGRPPPPPRAVRRRRHGPQGRGRRQRRDAGVHRAAAGSRPGRPVVLAGQGGDRVGPGRSPAEESVPPCRRAGGPGPTTDAGRERHLPRLDEGPPRRTATSTGASCAT